MAAFDPKAFGAGVAALLAERRVPSLGPGQPTRPSANIDLKSLASGRKVVDADAANACLVALHLHFDNWDEAHAIGQELTTTEGAYWHGIMHRREPDAYNAGYWFRRVGAHPVHELMRRTHPNWTPLGFIDRCERVRGANTPEERACEAIQLLEWQLLFAHCYGLAFGVK